MPSKMKKILNLGSKLTGGKSQKKKEDNSDGEESYPADSPEARIKAAIDDFCASGGAHGSGDEVTFLPTVVELAESSPGAAKEASKRIRKHIRVSQNKPYAQYNAVMLLRILSDNPGRIFTRNLGSTKFVNGVQNLWRAGNDPSVRQLLGETLEHFSQAKTDHEGLGPLILFWNQEKMTVAPVQSLRKLSGNLSRSRSPNIPPMSEMVTRISEAQSSAKLLHQVLSSTPKKDVPKNELVNEFVQRCQNASQSMHGYITSEEPLEEHLLTTLIETNELLSMALTRHQGILEAVRLGRDLEKTLSIQRTDSPPLVEQRDRDTDVPPLALPPSLGQAQTHPVHRSETPNSKLLEPFDSQNPFSDSHHLHHDDHGEGSSSAYNYESIPHAGESSSNNNRSQYDRYLRGEDDIDEEEERRRLEIIREGKKPVPIALQAGIDSGAQKELSERDKRVISPVSPVSENTGNIDSVYADYPSPPDDVPRYGHFHR